MKTRVSILIRCSPDRLWSFLEDVEKQKQWITGLETYENIVVTPNGLGSTFLFKIKEGKFTTEYQGEITKYEKPSGMSFTLKSTVSGSKDVVINIDYELFAEGSYATRFDYQIQVESARFTILARVFLPLYKLFNRARMLSMIKKLKSIAELPSA